LDEKQGISTPLPRCNGDLTEFDANIVTESPPIYIKILKKLALPWILLNNFVGL